MANQYALTLLHVHVSILVGCEQKENTRSQPSSLFLHSCSQLAPKIFANECHPNLALPFVVRVHRRLDPAHRIRPELHILEIEDLIFLPFLVVLPN